ncbi:DUF4192 domain-containing protein [Nocardia sp. NPDC050378]|uniref:DUF4192 domain-containing protein n=1 Tax=Nocardia sp. NPDC050378 TaxID=3155400 RepID=UPI0033EE08F3
MTSSTNPTRRANRSGPFRRALTCAETGPGYRDLPTPAVRVDEPGDLIAALPAMLGFVPERSLVVAVLHPHPTAAAAIDAVVRFDLDAVTDPDHYEHFLGCLGSICLREQASGVFAVFIDDRRRSFPATAARGHALLAAIGAQGIEVRGAWAVRAVAAGARYRSLLGTGGGLVADPDSSMVSLSHVLDGRQIRRSRGELTALVEPDEQLCARVRRKLGPAVARYRGGLATAQRVGEGAVFQRRALEWVLWQIADAASGPPRADREFARLAATLRDRAVRDALYGLAVTDHAEAAEGLWAQLARATPAGDRAEAAALLGFSAYVRGDGPFAGIALAAAVDADGDHPMAVLLETSLQSGLRPERLRTLAECGRQIAADLGVDLGPVRP